MGLLFESQIIEKRKFLGRKRETINEYESEERSTALPEHQAIYSELLIRKFHRKFVIIGVTDRMAVFYCSFQVCLFRPLEKKSVTLPEANRVDCRARSFW